MRHGLTAAAAKPLLAATDLVRTLRLYDLPMGARVRLSGVALRAWSRIWGRDFKLTFPKDGSIFFSGGNLNSDWNTFSEIFLTRCYSTDYEGAVVVDIGAHKGFFGAFALLHKAYSVQSFEPESSNYSLLLKTAKSFRARGHRWEINKLAVGHARAVVQLHVSSESWTHSLLLLPDRGRRRQVGVEQVQMIPLREILDQAAPRQRRTILKIDIEGAECEVVLETPTEAWRYVDETFIETHPFASCSVGTIIDHLKRSGLELLPDSTGQIAHLRRPTPNIPSG